MLTGNHAQRAIKKKDRIVEAAAALFQRYGVRRVTVEEICREAGASKMTFYKHFPNKLELLKHIWTTWIDEGYARLEEIDEMDIPFPAKLQKLIEYKSEQLAKMSWEYLDELLHSNPEMMAFFRETQEKNVRLFMTFLEKAQARGDMRPIRPELFLAVLDKLNDIARDENLISLYRDHVEFVREIQLFLFYGILPTNHSENEQ
ncbi:MAG: TetR/AcrR family transcriptional regulator [bacterium]